jgi:hypothetical protein
MLVCFSSTLYLWYGSPCMRTTSATCLAFVSVDTNNEQRWSLFKPCPGVLWKRKVLEIVLNDVQIMKAFI